MPGARRDARPVDSPPDGPTYTGRVIRVIQEKGFGFIKAEPNGDEFFFHLSNCYDGSWQAIVDGYDPETARRSGTKVTFEPKTTAKGPRAERVRLQA